MKDKTTEDMQIGWIGYSEAMDLYYKEKRREKLAALKEVRKIITGRRYRELLAYLLEQESEVVVSNYRIEHECIDKYYRQDADGWWKVEYVRQFSDGDSGDSWVGTVYIPLQENFYLVFDYSC